MSRLGRHPRITHECPNVENTIPLAVFQAQYPARFSLLDDDKFVLHAGGANFRLELVDSASSKTAVDPRLDLHGPVSLFVLNTCFVVWFNGTSAGIEIPYKLMALHALKEVEGVVVLYLQLLSCDLFTCIPLEQSEFTLTVELVISEGAQETAAPSPLVAHNDTILKIYEALSLCSALHYDSESDSEGFEPEPTEEPLLEIPTQWLNSGDADDLGMYHDSESDDEAGMNVALGTSQMAGQVRRRDSKSDGRKVRKLQ